MECLWNSSRAGEKLQTEEYWAVQEHIFKLAVIHRSAAWSQSGDCGDPGSGGSLHPNHIFTPVSGESLS